MDLYFFPDLIHDFFVDFNFLTLFIFLFMIIFYLIFCFIVFDMYKSLYGKNNYFAWVPVLNVYVLGDLLFGKTVGYVLCGGLLLISLLNTFVMYNMFISLLSIIYVICLLVVLCFAVYRYIYLKRNKINNSMASNTLNLENDNISPVKTNGPTESMINSINVIPTNDISNINSVPVQNDFTPKDSVKIDLSKNQSNNISNEIRNIDLFNNKNVVKPVENINTKITEEKHYEMPKLILEASENSNAKANNDNLVSKNNVNNEDFIPKIEEEKMTFITGVKDDEKMKFVTGDKIINGSYSNGNMAPKEEEITVVNGVIKSPSDIKTEEEEKMNIVNGTIVSNQNNNNNINSDSILDLNKKL